MQISAHELLPEGELFARIERAGPGHALQLRDPGLSARALLELGRRLRAATRAVGSWLVVNDRLDLAHVLEAEGVHLGRRSLAVEDARAIVGPLWISRSAHSVEEAARAAAEGADAIVLSPVFGSPGKGAPLGVEAIVRARAEIGETCLIALGGVSLENAESCLQAGADGVAAIRADLASLCGRR